MPPKGFTSTPARDSYDVVIIGGAIMGSSLDGAVETGRLGQPPGQRGPHDRAADDDDVIRCA